MSVFSSLRGSSILIKNGLKSANIVTNVQRQMGGHGPKTMHITPSRWQWHKFKDMFHFYIMLGAIPLGVLVVGVNIFVGPAQLAPIPEDYTPKHWEYYSHPITRFFARYVTRTPQQDYEKYLHFMYEENEKKQMRLLEFRIKAVMAEKGDIQSYYYRPVLTEYHKMVRDEYEKIKEQRGN